MSLFWVPSGCVALLSDCFQKVIMRAKAWTVSRPIVISIFYYFSSKRIIFLRDYFHLHLWIWYTHVSHLELKQNQPTITIGKSSTLNLMLIFADLDVFYFNKLLIFLPGQRLVWRPDWRKEAERNIIFFSSSSAKIIFFWGLNMLKNSLNCYTILYYIIWVLCSFFMVLNVLHFNKLLLEFKSFYIFH